jgi:hypothetical protein
VKVLTFLVAASAALTMAACSNNGTTASVPVTPQTTTTIAFVNQTPDTAAFAATPTVGSATTLAFVLEEDNSKGAIAGTTFTIAPPAGGTCLTITGSGTNFTASASGCHTFPVGANFAVTASTGDAVTLVLNTTSATQTP